VTSRIGLRAAAPGACSGGVGHGEIYLFATDRFDDFR